MTPKKKTRFTTLILAAITAICLTAVSLAPAAYSEPAKQGGIQDAAENRNDPAITLSASSVGFYKLDADGKAALDEDRIEYVYPVYLKGESYDSVPGASYDAATNTLTLDGVSAPNCALEINGMGADFKIVVMGECSVGTVISNGYGRDASVTITGDGVLTVNEEDRPVPGIGLNSGGIGYPHLNVGSDVTLHVYSDKCAVRSDEVRSIAKGVVNLPGGQDETLDYHAKKIGGDYVSKRVGVFYWDDGPVGKTFDRLISEEDPDGTYGAKAFFADGQMKYAVYKLVSVGADDLWLPDPGFAAIYRDDGQCYAVMTERALTRRGFSTVPNGENGIESFTVKTLARFSPDLELEVNDKGEYYIFEKEFDQMTNVIVDSFFRRVRTAEGLDNAVIAYEAEDEFPDPYIVEDPYYIGLYRVEVANDELSVGPRAAEKTWADFSDVSADAYFADSVRWATRKEISVGTTETTFSPDDGCTRAQVVTLLWRAAGEPEPEKNYNPFLDVDMDDWFYKAVIWAVEKGITNGTSGLTFSPDEVCTRGQIVTFLWRAKGSRDPARMISYALPEFSDVGESDYFKTAVQWASITKVTQGTASWVFSPNDACTRAQVVTFIYRARAL